MVGVNGQIAGLIDFRTPRGSWPRPPSGNSAICRAGPLAIGLVSQGSAPETRRHAAALGVDFDDAASRPRT